MLAQVPRSNLEILRHLQQSFHEEAKERDRLINQLERRRRQKMRDAIMVAEEGRRAELFRRMMAEEDAGGPLLTMTRLGASTFSGDDHTGLSSAQSRQLGLPEPAGATSELTDS